MSFGVNALLSGVTAGIGRHMNGRSFWRGFAQGAAGGGVAYGGRWISAQRFDGAGLIGRQAGALGASVVSNATAGRAALDRLVVPLGPVRFYFEPEARVPMRAKVDLGGVLAAGYFATQTGARLDLGASVSAAAPVFAFPEEYTGPGGAPLDLDVRAGHVAGVIWYRDTGASSSTEHVLAHEQVHVGHSDFAFLVWTEPVEDWLSAQLPGLARVRQYVDLGLHLPVWGAANAIVPYQHRPWEREAYFLVRAPSEPSVPGRIQ